MRAAIDDMFMRALELTDPRERDSYLDSVCDGDRSLREQVDKLLAIAPNLGSFLEAPATTPWTADTKPDSESVDLCGQTLGPYRLIRHAGKGGMGEVYLAEQQAPIRRRVAIKVIRTGLATEPMLARFAHESQLLGLMDHPNIARVLDAGTTPEGNPFIAMEWVEGIHITTFCDQQRYTIRQRVELLVTICQAVQHAHQKGIIHRDLKPANVLVTVKDGLAVPKIIDFGVARTTQVDLPDQERVTQAGQIIGTFEYMAPEQAESANADIDTRADVFALGALLYELLTGAAPIPKEEFRKAGIGERLRLIREVEPVRPSLRYVGLDDVASIAANRQTGVSHLSRLVAHELDWICLKCLEKDRARRYETTNALAQDLLRYLSGEPVLAGPPTARYRIGKFLNRNRGPVLAATLLLLALIGGVVGTSLGLVRANQSQKATDLALLDSQQQRVRAERHRQRAMAAVDRLLTRVGGVGLEAVPHMDDTRRRILEDALEFYREILKDESNDPVVRREVGMALQRIGAIETDLERLQEAEESLNRAIEVQQSLINEFRGKPEYEEDLVRSHRHLAMVMLKSSRIQEAERITDNMISRGWLETLAGRDEKFLLLFLRGRIFALTQRRDEAIVVGKQALELVNGTGSGESGSDIQIDRANLLGFLGILYADSRRFEDAEKCFRDAGDSWEGMLKEEPGNIRVQRGLGQLFGNWALAYGNSDRFADAITAYEKAIAVFTRLAHDHSSIPNYMWDLAKAHNNAALLHSKYGDPARAAKENENVVKLFEELIQRFPQRPEFVGSYAGSCANQGKYLSEQQQWAESIVWNSKAIDAADQFLKVDSRHTETHRFLHNSLIGRAGAYRRLNQTDLAIKDYRRSLEISEGEQHSIYARFRPRALAYIGEHARAVAEAELIVTNADATPSNFNEMAKVYATCIEAANQDTALVDAKRAELAERYAVRSVELLAKAAEKGHFETLEDISDLRSDDRLQPIQNRDDFRKLLSDLEKAHQPNR